MRDTEPTRHPNTGSITSCIINTLCHHCIWLSWTCSHTRSTFVPSSHTNLASTHTAIARPLHIPNVVLRLYLLYLTSDTVPKHVCEREKQKEREHYYMCLYIRILNTSWACNKAISYVYFQIHTAYHTHTCRPCRTSSKHLSSQLVFQTNRIYLMPRAWHWGNIGGLKREVETDYWDSNQ